MGSNPGGMAGPSAATLGPWPRGAAVLITLDIETTQNTSALEKFHCTKQKVFEKSLLNKSISSSSSSFLKSSRQRRGYLQYDHTLENNGKLSLLISCVFESFHFHRLYSRKDSGNCCPSYRHSEGLANDFTHGDQKTELPPRDQLSSNKYVH